MFSENDRHIFTYDDGLQERKADPLKVWREWNTYLSGELNKTLLDARLDVREDPSQAPRKLMAQSHLVRSARQVFQLPDIDPETGEGVLEEQVWEVVNAFLVFMSKKKQTPVKRPILPTPTASSPPPSLTRNTLGCC